MIAIVRVFAKGAAAEVPPQIEMTELHLRRLGVVAGQQAEERARRRVERVEQREDAREHLLARRRAARPPRAGTRGSASRNAAMSRSA